MTIMSWLSHHQLRLIPSRLSSTAKNYAYRHSHKSPSSLSKWQRHHHHGVIAPHSFSRRRCIVTSSTPPSPNVFIQRPEIIVLAESFLYDHSWKDFCTTFYPSMGLHFASIDIMKTTNNSKDCRVASMNSLERTMADDLSRLGESTDPLADLYIPGHAPTMSSSAHAVLIARGPLQCLVAQYFMESLPLAGLVLVDPLLLPEDGRIGTKKMKRPGEGESRWESSLSDLISMLEKNLSGWHSKTTTGRDSSSLDLELSLLRSLANDNKQRANHARPLRLEPGSVPTLVCHSGGDHAYGDYYRVCAERTASFHTCGGKGDYFDQVSVLKIPKKGNGENESAVDDLDLLSRTIYEWYEEVVA